MLDYNTININLHSNLVIFKSLRCPEDRVYLSSFTFQSGDIQMSQVKRPSYNHAQFTFQSGDIQITIKRKPRNSLFNLHSNLVIFKSTRLTEFFLNLEQFTFQSGDIQIIFKNVIIEPKVNIYIPIW